jgi:hypothetical protein
MYMRSPASTILNLLKPWYIFWSTFMRELIDNIWWSISSCSSFESTRMQLEDCTLHSTYVWNLNFSFYPFAWQKCCESDSKSCMLWQFSFSFCIAVQCLEEGFDLFPLYNAIKNWFFFCLLMNILSRYMKLLTCVIHFIGFWSAARVIEEQCQTSMFLVYLLRRFEPK